MHRLSGMLVPLVTPFDGHDEINLQALDETAAFAFSRGASGLVLTALTGEGNLLSAGEIETVWRRLIPRYSHRGDVVVTITSNTTREAIRLGRLAVDTGASIAMVAAIMPELYGKRAEKHVLCFFEDFCTAVNLPVMLFNYPALAGYDLTPELVEKLSAIENIRFIKESTGDIRRTTDITERTNGQIQVVCGSPAVGIESLMAGCKAWITGIMNIVPSAIHAVIMNVENNPDTADKFNRQVVLPACGLIQKWNNTIGTIKAGLSLRGIDAGIPRRPGLALEMTQEVKSAFETLFHVEEELLLKNQLTVKAG
jgi:4-hydroxy-tetrahydrodipicolinate synthase